MEVELKRYSLDDRRLLGIGKLTVISDGQLTNLQYNDEDLEIKSSALDYPLKALENLRTEMELKYNSVLNCAGCRIDTAYRPTGGYGTYIIELGNQAILRISLFEETNDVNKLSTIANHKQFYNNWCKSLNLHTPFPNQ